MKTQVQTVGLNLIHVLSTNVSIKSKVNKELMRVIAIPGSFNFFFLENHKKFEICSVIKLDLLRIS